MRNRYEMGKKFSLGNGYTSYQDASLIVAYRTRRRKNSLFSISSKSRLGVQHFIFKLNGSQSWKSIRDNTRGLFGKKTWEIVLLGVFVLGGCICNFGMRERSWIVVDKISGPWMFRKGNMSLYNRRLNRSFVRLCFGRKTRIPPRLIAWVYQ